MPDSMTLESMSDDPQKLKTELAAEQQRLAKLWDAFKGQEDDLKNVTKERDESLKQLTLLQKELSTYGTPAKIRGHIKRLEEENKQYEAEINLLSSRVDKYARLFNQEQERLAKLYKVYEDTAGRLASLRGGRATTKKASTSRSSGLTPKQRAQRQYAAKMRTVRARAAKSKGGKGKIAKRTAATKLRRQLGLKAGK